MAPKGAGFFSFWIRNENRKQLGKVGTSAPGRACGAGDDAGGIIALPRSMWGRPTQPGSTGAVRATRALSPDIGRQDPVILAGVKWHAGRSREPAARAPNAEVRR